ncbi:MAG: ectonucleotide pyrophosphatase/phosphodiesterase [bacterium]
MKVMMHSLVNHFLIIFKLIILISLIPFVAKASVLVQDSISILDTVVHVESLDSVPPVDSIVVTDSTKPYETIVKIHSIGNIENPYTILISFDGLRYDSMIGDTLKYFKYIKENGVKAHSLKPVFPTTTLPNHYSMLTGMYPVNHGVIVNSFKDPFYNDYFSSNSKGSRRLSKWYIAESFWETARRQGIKTAACYWTYPELEDYTKNPDYLIEFDGEVSYFDRVDEGFEWFEKDYVERPKFMAFYFEEADIKSHLFGTQSREMASGLLVIDSIVGYIYDKLKKINLFDSTNIIIVSDHGIMDFDSNKVIYVDSILSGIRYEVQNYGAFMMIDANKNVLQEVYDSLKSKSDNYDVYNSETIPEYLHFTKHPYISPIIILAKPGWILIDKTSEEKSKKIKAIHGYDNTELAMHGVFYAMGPSFKVNFQTGTINNLDIYPLLCEIFKILPRNNIDGKLDRIKFILKDKK